MQHYKITHPSMPSMIVPFDWANDDYPWEEGWRIAEHVPSYKFNQVEFDNWVEDMYKRQHSYSN